MKHQLIKLVLIFCALVALTTVTLSAASPIASAKRGFQKNKVDAALLAAIRAHPKGKFPVIVQTVAPTSSAAAPHLKLGSKNALRSVNTLRADSAMDLIQKYGGKKIQGGNRLSIIGGATATLRVRAIKKLSQDPFVSFILLDKPMLPLGTPAAALQSIYAEIVRAPEVWAQGDTGQGISIAILDSGIAEHQDLMLPESRIVASVDLVDPTAAPRIDPGGHGTHVAGIAAGNGTASDQAWQGIAPGANVVNVRVINSTGSTNLSTVIRGIQWVVQNRNTYNIRVMNLSLGATASLPYRNDPLAGAVEMAWNSGIVVVAAAGNGGPDAGTIGTPGIDPFIITVGALDDAGTVSTADDTPADFSSRGPTLDGLNKPDVAAPGRRIVSLRVPGSYLDNLLPDRVTDTNYFRLSGTSMAAPVVAGTSALILQRNPLLQPDQVKNILKGTTQPIGVLPDPNVLGAGLVDAFAATNSPAIGDANAGLTPADDFCKSIFPLLRGMPLEGIWRDPNYAGIDWSNVTWDNITWDRTTWENITWDNITWDNITWTNVTWDNVTWDNVTWDSTLDDVNVTWDLTGGLD